MLFEDAEDTMELYNISPELTCTCDEFHTCQQCKQEDEPEEVTILTVDIEKHYHDYRDALEHMIAQGVKHVGWLNSGITPPKGNYQKVYSNRSGTSCLYCDPVKRIAYSVNMGD